MIFLSLPWGVNIFYQSCLVHAAELPPSEVLNSKEEIPSNEDQTQLGYYLETAEDFYEKGNYEEAIEFWSSALAIDPGNRSAKDGIEMAKKKIAKVKEFFADYGEEQAKIEDYFEAAERFYKEGKYDEAIESYNDVLSINPEIQRAKDGIEMAKEKLAKIRDFFGSDIFGDFKYVSKYSLHNCIELAEKDNLQLQVAKEQIKLAEIKAWEAKRDFLPALTLSWTETKGIQSGGKIEGIEYGIEGKQPAFHSGELIYKLAQSKVNLSATEKNYDKAKSELYFEIAKAYHSFAKAKRLLEYTKNLYEEFKPLYAMAKKKYEEALVSDIEHLNAESKFKQLYYKSISVESDFKLARLMLAQKLNMENSEGLDVVTDGLTKGVDKNIETYYSLALENRPDLKISELIVKSTDYGKKIAQAKESPYVDLTGHYKKASEVYREDYSAPYEEMKLDPQREWYAGLELNWPFFGSTGTYSAYKREDPPTLRTYYIGAESRGTTWKLGILDNVKQFSNTAEAEIAYVQAEKELDEMRKKVIMEVEEAFYGYEKARIQLEAAEVQKVFREKELKILELKHNIGETELSTLFESMVHLMEASETYLEAEKDLNIAIAALNKAAGLMDYF